MDVDLYSCLTALFHKILRLAFSSRAVSVVESDGDTACIQLSHDNVFKEIMCSHLHHGLIERNVDKDVKSHIADQFHLLFLGADQLDCIRVIIRSLKNEVERMI